MRPAISSLCAREAHDEVVVGVARAGRRGRAPARGPEARVPGCRHPHACPRDRREHGDVQRRVRRPPQAAALRAGGQAGQRQEHRSRHWMAARGVGGGPILHLPGRAAGVRGRRRLAGGPRGHHRRRRAGAGHRAHGDRRLPPDPQGRAHARPTVHARGRRAGQPAAGDHHLRILATALRRPPGRPRADDHRQRIAQRDHRRPPPLVRLPRRDAVPVDAARLRPLDDDHRELLLSGPRQAQAGPDARAGPPRRGPDDPADAAEVPALTRPGPDLVCRREAGARRPLPLRRRRGRRGARALGADGDDRHGAPRCLRQRGESVPGPRRQPADGTGRARRAGRRPVEDCADAVVGERGPRPRRRARRRRSGRGDGPRRAGDRADGAAARRGHRHRPGGAAVRGRAVGGRRADVRPAARVPLLVAAPGRPEGRRTDRQRRPVAQPRPQRAGGRGDRARPRPARRLRPDVQDVLRPSAGRSRLRAGRPGDDRGTGHSAGLLDQPGAHHAPAPGDCRPDGRHPGRAVGGDDLLGRDGRAGDVESAARRTLSAARGAGGAVAPDEVDLARLLRNHGHAARGRTPPDVGGRLRLRAGARGQRADGPPVPGRRRPRPSGSAPGSRP